MKKVLFMIALVLALACGCCTVPKYVIYDAHYHDFHRGWNGWVHYSKATVYPSRPLAWIVATEYRWSRRGQAWYGGGERWWGVAEPIVCIYIVNTASITNDCTLWMSDIDAQIERQP